MPDNTTQTSPVIIEEPRRRRRAAAFLGIGALGAMALIGVTMASFTDAEYAALNGSGDGYAVAAWNIQISADGNAWVDTTSPSTPGQPDNLPIDVQAPIDLAIAGADALVPGDAATNVTATLYVRNEDTSARNAQLLKFRLLEDSTATDTALRDALRFTVSDGQSTFASLSYSALSTGVALSQPVIAPGSVVTYTITVSLPDQGSATQNAALQGLRANLLAAIDGVSTVAAAT
ncbi:hypothetical protein AB1K54_10355 [Microbacterium sp. BWT-B31]|uniref:hypothetical protein n=1 Tax=Microbacterium sp. BWT-B31 TaxID=3232072 RepID=UPI00352917BF